MFETETILDNAVLLVDGHYGIYIPQIFAEQFPRSITRQQKEDLSDPNNEFYWEAWEDVLNEATVWINDKPYYLLQEDDLWAIPKEG